MMHEPIVTPVLTTKLPSYQARPAPTPPPAPRLDPLAERERASRCPAPHGGLVPTADAILGALSVVKRDQRRAATSKLSFGVGESRWHDRREERLPSL